MDIQFRKIKKQDIESFIDICKDIGYDLRYENISNRIRDLSKTETSDLILAVDESKTILGWIQIEICNFILIEKCANIKGLFIDKKFRGRKIGKMLINQAYNWAKQNNCTGITISTHKSRIDSHDFYTHIGFKNLNVHSTYYKALDDF